MEFIVLLGYLYEIRVLIGIVLLVSLLIILSYFWLLRERWVCQVCERKIKKGDKFCSKHSGELNSDEKKALNIHKSLWPLGIIGAWVIWINEENIITYIYFAIIFILFIYFKILKRKLR